MEAVGGACCCAFPVLLVVGGLVMGRRRRMLSGTVATKPVFSVDPPRRSPSRRMDESL